MRVFLTKRLFPQPRHVTSSMSSIGALEVFALRSASTLSVVTFTWQGPQMDVLFPARRNDPHFEQRLVISEELRHGCSLTLRVLVALADVLHLLLHDPLEVVSTENYQIVRRRPHAQRQSRCR